MFQCASCLRRCMRIFIGDAQGSLRPELRKIARPRAPQTPNRTLRWQSQRARYSQAAQASTSASEESPDPTPALSTMTMEKPRQTRKKVEPSTYSRSELEKELQWVRDPLRLADRTVTLLKEDQYLKALSLVRLASKDVPCTVSWNHLVDYNMSRGHIAVALKIYNEMKKRAQIPDAHTFTTLFRGFATHPNLPSSVERALAIYNSMLLPKSPVKPSIIHTNAVIKVCAMAGDMEALFGVAAKLPERGSSAPDNWTYTVILNAIRVNVSGDASQFGPGELDQARARGIRQGRMVSKEIIEKWKQGNLRMDELLACAMGRMLLQGGLQDVDDILSLVDQTMGVQRQAPLLKDPNRPSLNPRIQSLYFQGNEDADPGSEKYDDGVSSDTLDLSLSRMDPIPSLFPTLEKQARKGIAKPGRNTLSLLLEACRRMDLTGSAQSYWELLTGPEYGIVPDSANYHEYLRCLRHRRASRLVLEVLQEMRERTTPTTTDGRRPHTGTRRPILEAKSFNIGLSTCVRDKNNQNSHAHAASMIRLMLDTLADPDPAALENYLRLTLYSPHTKDNWQRLLGAEQLVHEGWENLRSYSTWAEEKPKAKSMDAIEDVTVLFLKLYDHIFRIGREQIPGLNALRKRSTTVKEWSSKRKLRRDDKLSHRKLRQRTRDRFSSGEEVEDVGDRDNMAPRKAANEAFS